MAKEIFQFKMQKQKKQIKSNTNKTIKRKKQSIDDSKDDTNNQIHFLTKKLKNLGIQAESQTQDHKSEVNKAQKKSLSKKKSIKKSLSKQKEDADDEKILLEYQKINKSLCKIHLSKDRYIDQNYKISPNGELSFEWFKKIKSIWKSQKDRGSQNSRQVLQIGLKKQTKFIKKTERITYVQQITQNMLGRLKPKHWLNDEVINSYIQLLELDILKKDSQKMNNQKIQQSSVHLFQSYFAALKITSQKIQREIKKRRLTTSSLIVIPINEDCHWFFLVIFDYKIYVCDSILPKDTKQSEGISMLNRIYSMKQSIRKCLKLYEVLYNVQQILLADIHILEMFPQQDNQNDCGMMMLCGIRNILTIFLAFQKLNQHKQFVNLIKSKIFWRFCNDDITFYRFLYTKEIIQETILAY